MEQIIDDLDRRILSVLQQDASLSMDALSEAVSLSRNACWRRVRRLEETGVITGRVTLVDAGRVGLPLTAFVLIRAGRHDEGWLAAFSRVVQAIPQIQSAQRLSGDLDYILRIRLASMADYDRVYKDLISRVPLSDVSASFVMEDIKDTTALPV